MAKSRREPTRGRRDSADQDRDKGVYRYLFTLTDLELNGNPPTPNESSIAKQWGMEDNRIFIRRVLRSVMHDQYYADETIPTVPGLTLGKLVKILAAIEQHWAHKRSSSSHQQAPRIITRAEKLQALRKFFHLSADERAHLKLPSHPGEALLQRLLDAAADPVTGLNLEGSINFYQSFLRQHQTIPITHSQAIQSREAREDLIRNLVEQLIEQYFEGIDASQASNKTSRLVDKVQREISRIELQAGIKQAKSFLNKQAIYDRQDDGSGYLTPHFIQRLTCAVVENEILTDEFPIHLKYVEIEKARPLPLYVKKTGLDIGLLNPFLLEIDEDEDSINGLERQVAYKITVYIDIKLPDDYVTQFPDISITNQLEHRQLDFSEEIIGIGSPISHIIAAINRILFWGIPALKDYLPIADAVFSNCEVIGGTDRSPAWCHHLVRLYKNEDINSAIAEDRSCDEVTQSYESAYGEFCGFDSVEVSAKAALNARLRLIKQTGVDSRTYLQQLCHHIEELNAFKKAKTYLELYPCSLRAMEGAMERTIFRNRYRTRDQQFRFTEFSPDFWSSAAYAAHIEIAKSNLKEGLYRVGKQYLDALKPHFKEENKDFLGNLLFAKYHLCWFRYYYLIDLNDPDCPYPDRYQAVRAAEDELEEAEKALRNRLDKYSKLKELPQTNFHPHFYLLSRIYAHRAKLHLFFPAYTRQTDKWNALLEPIRLLEKARIFAARDGNSVFYAQWSAYQSWSYLMAAYLGDQNELPNQAFERDQCIDWAQRLIDHALRCYSSHGKLCYQRIKDNGGKTTDQSYPSGHLSTPAQVETVEGAQSIPVQGKMYYETYGKTRIQVVPLIQEWEASDHSVYDPIGNVVSLDFSLLKKLGQDDITSTYLFGSRASIILFSMGMLELCQEQQAPNRLLDNIRHKGLRLFTYCWAIASDGTTRNDPLDSHENEFIYLNRAFAEAGDSALQAINEDASLSRDYLLRGLYPHRLTEFADLGQIFVIVCKLLLTAFSPAVLDYYRSKQTWEETIQSVHPELTVITELTDELVTNTRFPTPEILGQSRYNGHLAEHYKNFKHYVAQFIEQIHLKQFAPLNAIEVRTQLMRKIFQIIRGNAV